MLKLRFAAGGYDRLDALQYGIIQPEGIELEFNEINAPRRIFDGMLGGGLFDVSEFSSSEFITRTLRGNFPFSHQKPSVMDLSISTSMPGSPRPKTSKANASGYRNIHKPPQSGSAATYSMIMMSIGRQCVGSKARSNRPVNTLKSKPPHLRYRLFLCPIPPANQ